MPKPLQLKAQMQPALRKADGSVSLRFVTAEEINTETFSLIDSWRQSNGWVMFKKNEFAEGDIPSGDAEDDGRLKLWERQQKALYKLHMLRGGSPDEFHTFYREQMNLFMSVISDKIEGLEGKNNATNTGART